MSKVIRAIRRASPLAHSKLRITIRDLLAEYELRHTFRNDSDEPIEAIYSFPVPLDAAFLGMEATFAGEKRIARVQAAHAACTRFDDAIAMGDSAVLIERLEPGLLCVDLGNLAPDEDGEVVLRFAAALNVADGVARFCLPLVHRPRFGRSRLDDLVEPDHDFAVEHTLEAEIQVTGLLAQATVQCPTHGALFERYGATTTLKLAGALLDRDLVVNFELPLGSAFHGRMVEGDGAGGIGIVTFTTPKCENASGPLDLCLILDGSGSMAGDAITQSRAALHAVARNLADNDRIQVLRFGTSVLPLFRRPLRATERVREAMHALAGTVAADLGGTKISRALIQGIDSLKTFNDSNSRAIVLVTDGAVEPREIEAAQAQAVTTGIRIFVVAVGSSAGADVLAPLTSATCAVLERAVPGEPIDVGVMRQFRRARQAGPLDVHVEWGIGVRVLATDLAYAGDAVTSIAFLPDKHARTVTMRVPDGKPPVTITVDHVESSAAWRAWAGQQAYWQTAKPEREMVALRYGLITEETSAVLVKQRAYAEKSGGLPYVVPVAHMVPEGMVATTHPRHTSTRDHLDIPAFLRRSVDESTRSQRRFLSSPERGALQLSRERTAEVRVELRRALDKLLLSGQPVVFSVEALLRLLAPALRKDARAYLLQGSIERLQDACELLRQLADEEVGPPLSDDDEAHLTVAQFAA